MDRLSCGFEVKLAGDASEMTFSGYGAVFGNVDSHGDVIAKGAFRDTLREAKRDGVWPEMLLQHGGGMFGGDADSMTPIGIWTDLEEDGVGLKVEGKLADTQRGRDTYALLKMTPRPAITGLSIGYRPKEFALGTKPDEPRRTLKKVDLLEVSLVTFPANPKARVTGVKSDFDPREMEEALAEAGLSRSDRKKAVAVLRKMLLRDAGAPGSDPCDEGAAAELVASLNRAAASLQSVTR